MIETRPRPRVVEVAVGAEALVRHGILSTLRLAGLDTGKRFRVLDDRGDGVLRVEGHPSHMLYAVEPVQTILLPEA